MRKRTRIAIAVALLCIILGAILFAGTLASVGFDPSRLSTMQLETNTYEVSGNFTNIRIEGTECDVRLLPSQTGECKVVCFDRDSTSHTVAVNDSTLTITRTDTRAWYENIGIYWGVESEPAITVQLPARTYTDLFVETLSGDVSIPDDFTFSQAEIKTASGKIDLEHLNALYVSAYSSSGDIEFSDVLASSRLEIETVSGEVELEQCDALDLLINSVSGNVSGTLCSEKRFTTSTTSGNVNVPKTASLNAGSCEVNTTSGNIRFAISTKE